MKTSLFVFLLLALPIAAFAQPADLIIDTVAGQAGVGDGGSVQNALFSDPQGVTLTINTVTQITTIYVADREHNRVRRIGQNVSTLAGTGFAGSSGDGAPANAARLNGPSDVALDTAGNIYIADTGNHKVRRVTPGGVITTFAGNGAPGSSGDGGQAASATLGLIEGIVRDGLVNLFIADTTNHHIRKVDASGVITTVAGTGTAGFSGDGGPATAAQLSSPVGLAFGRPGTIYQGALLIVDSGNHRVRMIKDGVISTIAGNGGAGFAGDGGQATSAEFGQARRVALDQAGNLFVTQRAGGRIRRVTAGGVTSTVAGAGFGFGGDGGQAVNALMRNPEGVVTAGTGTFYVVDSSNHRIRRVGPNPGVISTFSGRRHDAGDGGPATGAGLFRPFGLETDAQANLLIADTMNHRVRKLTFSSGAALEGSESEKGAAVATISTIAGSGATGFSGDGGAGTAAKLAEPRDVAVSSVGNIFIADYLNHRIRRVATDGTISTFAGNGTQGFGGDGGAATGASLDSPSGVALDLQRNVYVADTGNHRIRKITPVGVISTFAGTGVAGFSGDGDVATKAQLNMPTGIGVDGSGNVFIADTQNRRIRAITPGGIISTVAGNGMAGFGGDGGPATQAQIEPWDVALGPQGRLFIADGVARVRRVTNPLFGGSIVAVVGTGTPGFSGDGGDPVAARIHRPRGLALDVLNTMFVADSANNVIRRIVSEGPGPPLITTAGVVDAAGFGPLLAPDSIATAFVRNGDNGSIKITDSQGVTRDSDIFFNGGSQINFLIDAATALGAATIRLRRSGMMSEAPITISNTGAGIFFASGVGGQAVGLAQYLKVSNGVAGPLLLTYDPTNLSLVPINLGTPSDQVFLVLYCTGLRNAANVQVTIGGTNVPVFARAAAPGFNGLDQVNVGRIPRSFINAGAVKVQLIVDGVVTNTVDVRFD